MIFLRQKVLEHNLWMKTEKKNMQDVQVRAEQKKKRNRILKEYVANLVIDKACLDENM